MVQIKPLILVKYLLCLMAIVVVCFNADAQLNLKKKLEKKADQEIDKLLFKKKKKDSEDTDATYDVPGGGNVSSTGSSSSRSDDNYEPKPVDFGSLNGEELVHFTVLIDMLPEETNGYQRSEKPDGSIYKSASFNISTGSKEYLKDGKSLQLTLYDYKDAAMLYTSQAGQFYEYESTDGYTKTIEVGGYQGWVSQDYDDNNLTLFVGVKERYILTADMEGGVLEVVESIVKEIPVDKLP